MGRVRKKRIKIKYGKSKGTIPRPIVFSETKAGMKAAARQRRRRAAAPKKPIEAKKTIEPVVAVDFKEPVPAIYEPENIAAEIRSITDEVVETLKKELATDEPPQYGMLELGVDDFAKESGMEKEEAAGRMAYMIKDELKKLIDGNDRKKTISFLDMLREKSLYELSTIFNLGKGEAKHLKSAMMGERFLTLIDPNMSIRKIEENSDVGRNTVLNYRTALKALGPEIARYRTRNTPIDKMSDLYDHILELVEASKDGITPTGILSDCGDAYGMPTIRKSDRKWTILDEIARVEKDGKITFRDGKYFPCEK
jgi:hypothetical protein